MVIFRENTRRHLRPASNTAGGVAQISQKILDFMAQNFPKEFKKIRFGHQGKLRKAGRKC